MIEFTDNDKTLTECINADFFELVLGEAGKGLEVDLVALEHLAVLSQSLGQIIIE